MEIKCVYCDALIRIPDDAVRGEIVHCTDCGTSYEIVIEGDSLYLKEAEKIEEDWGE
jgi:lysine biosynthesis protein LysW